MYVSCDISSIDARNTVEQRLLGKHVLDRIFGREYTTHSELLVQYSLSAFY